jgi:hypothetical protein
MRGGNAAPHLLCRIEAPVMKLDLSDASKTTAADISFAVPPVLSEWSQRPSLPRPAWQTNARSSPSLPVRGRSRRRVGLAARKGLLPSLADLLSLRDYRQSSTVELIAAYQEIKSQVQDDHRDVSRTCSRLDHREAMLGGPVVLLVHEFPGHANTTCVRVHTAQPAVEQMRPAPVGKLEPHQPLVAYSRMKYRCCQVRKPVG